PAAPVVDFCTAVSNLASMVIPPSERCAKPLRTPFTYRNKPETTRFSDRPKFLNDNNIAFAIRLREDLRVTTEDGSDLALAARLRRAGRTRFFQARLGTREDAATEDAPLLNFAA